MGKHYQEQVERNVEKISKAFGDLKYGQRKEIARLVAEAALAAEAFQFENDRG